LVSRTNRSRCFGLNCRSHVYLNRQNFGRQDKTRCAAQLDQNLFQCPTKSIF
jgi:hypothetical protein